MQAEAELPPAKDAIRFKSPIQLPEPLGCLAAPLGNVGLQCRVDLANRPASEACIPGRLRRSNPATLPGNQLLGALVAVLLSLRAFVEETLGVVPQPP